jgi:hypothetical protein
LPVIDLLRNYFRIASEDDERTRREKVTGRVVALDRSLEDTLPYLFGLLGIVEGDDPLAQMDGQIKKRRTLEAARPTVSKARLPMRKCQVTRARSSVPAPASPVTNAPTVKNVPMEVAVIVLQSIGVVL